MKVLDAINYVRERLLFATGAITDGDEKQAAEELESATARLREVVEELKS